MSEESVVRYCSPTLAGIKTGSMFSCVFKNRREMTECICRMNRIFVKKGMRVLPLRYRDGKALIYIFRPSLLKKDLSDDIAKEVLCERGYPYNAPDRCIVWLIRRLEECSDFPHEIGLFLGYPARDVCGFIEDKHNFKCSGFWKVYDDEEAAQRTFERYRKCTLFYQKRLAEGFPFERLLLRTEH